MSKEKWRLVQATFESKGLQATLLEAMNWLIPTSPIDKLIVAGEEVKITVLAQLPGAALIDIEDLGKGSTKWHRSVDQELKKYFPERITRYRHTSGDSWYWPKKLSSGSLSYDRLPTRHNSLPDYLAQRLAGLSFSFEEHSGPQGIAPNTVKERIRGQFEAGKVTSDFFAKFKQRHEVLTSVIFGLPDTKAASSYATLILNRLMFIYFLQKKEFLNGDPDYLKSCLKKVQGLHGKDRFYNFYKDYLLELFFSKLDRRDGIIGDPEIEAIAGSIPYINGGVFSKSHAEDAFEINIPDSAFEEIFTFFDSYTWHLDTRPTGSPKEINPEVIGYIFEQYINFTAGGKKENGAYYTKHDVTGYMVGQTLVPRIMDEVLALGLDPFQLLKSNPGAYLHESMKHGFDDVTNSWVAIDGDLAACWNGDPLGWSLLDDTELDFEVCLPDETWVEMLYRRERVEKLKLDLAGGAVKGVNDLITLNLDVQSLLTDLIAQTEKASALEDLWSKVSSLSVIDPTCGSGAFLFAALEILEDVYAHIADRIAEVNSESKILLELAAHPNRRYFLRKHAALRNLYGTDIMEDAIETAKLRVFLALASCLESKDQIEPLPDLDFNLKVGNLVVGFKDADDVSRVDNGRLIIDNKIADLETEIHKHIGTYDAFVTSSTANHEDLGELKSRLELSYSHLKKAADIYYAECTGKSAEDFEEWAIEAKPFHWVIEFPLISKRGGFDVVIGNPPYIGRSKLSESERANIIGFETNDFKDFYAVCFERALSLLSPDGRQSFVVMLSLSFGKTYESLRKVIRNREGVEWWSTFGRWPDGLFTGARVRNTILATGPGKPAIQATQHNILTSRVQSWVFANLEYFESHPKGFEPPVRGGIAHTLAEIIHETGCSYENGVESVFVRPTAAYWFPALFSNPPVINMDLSIIEPRDTRTMKIILPSGMKAEFGASLLGGKLAYLYWQSVGDDFDVNGREIQPIVSFGRGAMGSSNLERLALEVENRSRTAYFFSNNAKACYLSIRWNSIRSATDLFDREFLSEVGSSEHWRNLNIWYRRTMRSTRENMNSTNLSPEQSSALLDQGN
jgi:hypothetical protein